MNLSINFDMHQYTFNESKFRSNLILVRVMFVDPVSSGLHHLRLGFEGDLNTCWVVVLNDMLDWFRWCSVALRSMCGCKLDGLVDSVGLSGLVSAVLIVISIFLVLKESFDTRKHPIWRMIKLKVGFFNHFCFYFIYLFSRYMWLLSSLVWIGRNLTWIKERGNAHSLHFVSSMASLSFLWMDSCIFGLLM